MSSGAADPEKNTPGEEQPKSPEHLPFMLDFSLSVAQLVVILVGLATAGVSVVSGAAPWMAAVRGGAAVLAVGLVLWAVNYRLSKDSLEMARLELAKQSEQASDERSASTVERTA